MLKGENHRPFNELEKFYFAEMENPYWHFHPPLSLP